MYSRLMTTLLVLASPDTFVVHAMFSLLRVAWNCTEIFLPLTSTKKPSFPVPLVCPSAPSTASGLLAASLKWFCCGNNPFFSLRILVVLVDWSVYVTDPEVKRGLSRRELAHSQVSESWPENSVHLHFVVGYHADTFDERYLSSMRCSCEWSGFNLLQVFIWSWQARPLRYFSIAIFLSHFILNPPFE